MMEHQQYSFLVSSVRGQNSTDKTWFLLDAPESGSPYNISVVTVGVFNYLSTEVTAENYTSKWDWPINSKNISICKLLQIFCILWSSFMEVFIHLCIALTVKIVLIFDSIVHL